MSEPENEPKTGMSMGDLRSLIGEMVSTAMGVAGGKTTQEAEKDSKTERQSSRSIAQEVREELERLRQVEERQKSEADLRKDVADLKEKAKGPEEKPPVERRRVHKLMGWGDN